MLSLCVFYCLLRSNLKVEFGKDGLFVVYECYVKCLVCVYIMMMINYVRLIIFVSYNYVFGCCSYMIRLIGRRRLNNIWMKILMYW